MQAELKITFLSEWQCGSGLGESHLADAVLNRDADGIPVITGRTVKGALREGAWRLSRLSGRGDLVDEMENIWGGTGEDPRPGKIFVSSASLPADVRSFLLAKHAGEERAEAVSLLTVRRSQTALKGGVAQKGSLRTMECGIPGLEFFATISLDVPEAQEDWYRSYLSAVCAAVKSIGADRARGLGQCRLTLTGMPGGKQGTVAIPARRIQ